MHCTVHLVGHVNVVIDLETLPTGVTPVAPADHYAGRRNPQGDKMLHPVVSRPAKTAAGTNNTAATKKNGTPQSAKRDDPTCAGDSDAPAA